MLEPYTDEAAALEEDRGDFEWLVARAISFRVKDPEKYARFVYALEVDKLPIYKCAEVAGYSFGPSAKTQEQQRNALAAQGSRAKNAKRMGRLIKEFRQHRNMGDDNILEASEVLSSISEEARNGSGATRIAASKILLEFHKSQPRNELSVEDAAKILIDRLKDIQLAHIVAARMYPAFVPAIETIAKQRGIQLEPDTFGNDAQRTANGTAMANIPRRSQIVPPNRNSSRSRSSIVLGGLS